MEDFYTMADSYLCMEQYMMAGKAGLFGDSEIREQILKCSDPKQIKALGRKVRSFDQKVWDKFKYAIVLLGNWYKFSQNRELREFLLSTGGSVLVEASPYDNIWGIRLPASSDVFGKTASAITTRILENPAEKITDVSGFRTKGMKATNEQKPHTSKRGIHRKG